MLELTQICFLFASPLSTMNLHHLSANLGSKRKVFFRSSMSILLLTVIVLAGCGTTTNRIATEQLLLSDAVDQAIGKIDFSCLSGHAVYLDTIYLRSAKGTNTLVNAEYVISGLRQQLLAANCPIKDNPDDAEIIVEARLGALGTDGHEIVYGIPQSGTLNVAAQAVTSSPMAVIPEISVGKNNQQSGIAKIIVFAYDRESHEPIWQSGIAKAESTSKDTWFLGAGPFQKGSIYEGMRFAGKGLKDTPSEPPPPTTVPFTDLHVFTELPAVVPPAPQIVPAEKRTLNALEPIRIGTASFNETITDE